MKPMLAHDYKKRGHNITYPAYVQPKLDGIRCLAERDGNTISYTSRDNKDFVCVDHLTPHLLKLMKDGDTWDGELYTKALTFQEIVSAVKRKQPNTLKIEYWVYDCVMAGDFEDRHYYIDSRIKNSGPILPVTTLLINSEEEMLTCHNVMLSKGYEGTMVRNVKGEYLPSDANGRNKARSPNLQKYKDMEDAEFKIVGASEGEGKDKGCVIFTCVTDNGKEFEARPNGKYARRERWYKDRKKLIGKMLTVQYQGFTDEGKPRFPIALEIRDYE